MKKYIIVYETASSQTNTKTVFGRNSHDAVRVLMQQAVSNAYDIEFIVSVEEVQK